MSSERKKITLYLHPESPADKQALDVIEKIPRSWLGISINEVTYESSVLSGMFLLNSDFLFVD